MNFEHRILHELVMRKCQGAYRRFMAHTANPRTTQKRILHRILKKNTHSLYGQHHSFADINNIDGFRKTVPVSDYRQLHKHIEMAASSNDAVLTQEKIRLFEPTGGTSGSTKLIPYTASLQKEYQHALDVWLFDLYHHFPLLKMGRHFWSISPLTHKRQYTRNGTPIGFESDANYLGWAGRILSRLMIAPVMLREIADTERFLYLTALSLVNGSDCTLISVWNPTYLQLLLTIVHNQTESILKDVHDGIRNADRNIVLPLSVKPNPERSKQVARMFARADGRQQLHAKLFPKLSLISCWADAGCRFYASNLQKEFPHVAIQPKGLLSTEGVISIPLAGQQGGAIAYIAHFYEFLDTQSSNSYLLDELEVGKSYSVCITTGGGLYRYLTGDRVYVTGHIKAVPLVVFTGRDNVCDLVGEKLHEGEVIIALTESLAENGIEAAYIMLAPEKTYHGGHYEVYLEPENSVSHPIEAYFRLLHGIELRLRNNFHYNYARDLGQLSALKLFIVIRNARESFIKRSMRDGQALGDIKPAMLDRRSGWADFFEGSFVSQRKTVGATI